MIPLTSARRTPSSMAAARLQLKLGKALVNLPILHHRSDYYSHIECLIPTLFFCKNIPHQQRHYFYRGFSSSTNNNNNDIIFPWRHKEHLLSRVAREMHRTNNDYKMRLGLFLCETGTSLLMGYPLFDLLLGRRKWRHELAENSAWVFLYGLSSLLSNIYKGKYSTVMHDESKIAVGG